MAKVHQIILLVCALIASVVCDAALDKMIEHKKQTRKVCEEKTKAPADLIDGISAGKFPDGNKELKCFTACVLEQMGCMKDGKLDKDTALQVIDTAMPESFRAGAKKALIECGAKYESITDTCDLSFEMIKCWNSIDPSSMI